jgi:ABC-type lipoprotein export system ATPase subunit
MVTHDPRYGDMAKQQLHLLDGRMADLPLVLEAV